MASKYTIYTMYDKPIPYRDRLIYPVTMENYLQFHYYAACLLLDKDSVPDTRVISMSYLDYLYYYTVNNNDQDNSMIALLDALLRLVFRDEKLSIRYKYDENKKAVFIIDDEIFNGTDFEEIKEIVCEQNLLQLPDLNVQKEVREKIQEAEDLRRKINNQKMASLEDQMICVMITTPLKLQDIYELSIRKFIKVLQRVDHKLHYEIYLSASMSGMVEFKDKSFIKHWMSDLDTQKNESILELDQIKNKLNFE